MYNLKVISTGQFDDRGYTDNESIAALQLKGESQINSFLTYNYGREENQFPLLFMTEGQGSVGTVEHPDIEWTWPIMGKQEWTDYVTHFAGSTPGLGGTDFEVHFATHRFIEQYGLIGPDGKTRVRIQKDLGPSAHGYGYVLRFLSTDATQFVDPTANLQKGMYWSMTAPTVTESYSKGNRTNSVAPGKMKSQMSIYRYTQEVGGDAAHTVVKYEFTDSSGRKNNLWINEVMRQFNIRIRKMNEELLWNSEYNRNENGEIVLKDYDNGKPIPHTSGMLEICSESNYDTYGEVLTLNKLKRTVGDIIDNNCDTGKMEIILMAGKGFMEDFDEALKLESKNNGFLTPLGDQMITPEAGGLTYGNYFRKYRTIEGHIVSIVHAAYFDRGAVAEAARKNGRIHPRTGLPITSHSAAVIDFSRYDGVNNVRVVHQKNQKYTAKVVQGIAPIPACWGIPTISHAATDVDMSTLEIKGTIGLQVNNARKMMFLECKL